MKKFINDVSQVEDQMIQGMVKAYPDHLRKLDCGNVVVRAQKKEGKVALISGGGSGHEPAHGGFVGEGMLDAAVAGAVFTSPTPDQIYEGIKAIATDKGVLMVVKNYTGDVMNFEMAADMAEAEGIPVQYVVTNDDVAVKDSLYTIGRRGVAGTIFVHKIAGAKAETGASLDEVHAVAQKVVDNVRPWVRQSVHVSYRQLENRDLNLATTKLRSESVFMESLELIGKRCVRQMRLWIFCWSRFCQIWTIQEVKWHFWSTDTGGTPLMELYILNNHIADVLAERGIKVYRTMVGNYMTSIEMQGFSISLLKLDDEMKELLDAKADTPAWKE